MGFFTDQGANPDNLEFQLLPVLADEGAPDKRIYSVVASAKYALSRAGNDMVNITFEVTEPEEFAGRKVTDRLMFSTEKFKSGNSNGCPLDITMARLEGVFGEDWVEALDGDLVGEVIPAIVAGLTDMCMCIKVSQKDEEYEGETKTKNRVTQYYDLTAYLGIGEVDDNE